MTKYSFVVVCEGPADCITGTQIADRVLSSKIAWLAEQDLSAIREWRGLTSADGFLPWMKVLELARERRIRAHGHFEGEPGAADARTARAALLLIKHVGSPDGVLLLRDSDGDSTRSTGLDQARRQEHPWGFAVVIGVAHCKREAWVLNGFEPRDDTERERLSQLRSELGFHPCEKPEELDASQHRAKRDAKRVLKRLVRGDGEREAACWKEADLTVLKARGIGSGLAEYMAEIEKHLAPVIQP